MDIRHGFVRLLGALLVAALGFGGAADARAPSGRHWSAKSGVRVSAEVRTKLDAIAGLYHGKTKRKLLVTSGTRTPAEQASAMYKKLRAGSRLGIYRNEAAVSPIRKVYDRGRKKRWRRAKIIAEITSLIEGQCERGVYISRHLKANAFDVRSLYLTRRQKKAFRDAVRAVGGVSVVEERKPPHFHLELR